MDRENMTTEQELELVNKLFDEFEKEGFSKIFVSPFDLLPSGEEYQGKPFKVLCRVKPILGNEEVIEEDMADLEMLPMWRIQFEDGHVMGAYPEEIIPSQIREAMWRESDKKYLKML